MKKILKSYLQERGQVTIPIEAREALHLKPGSEIIFFVHDGELIIKPLLKDPLKNAGMLGRDPETKRVKDLRMRYHDW